MAKCPLCYGSRFITAAGERLPCPKCEKSVEIGSTDETQKEISGNDVKASKTIRVVYFIYVVLAIFTLIALWLAQGTWHMLFLLPVFSIVAILSVFAFGLLFHDVMKLFFTENVAAERMQELFIRICITPCIIASFIVIIFVL